MFGRGNDSAEYFRQYTNFGLDIDLQADAKALTPPLINRDSDGNMATGYMVTDLGSGGTVRVEMKDGRVETVDAVLNLREDVFIAKIIAAGTDVAKIKVYY